MDIVLLGMFLDSVIGFLLDLLLVFPTVKCWGLFFFLEFSSVKNVSIVPMRFLSGQRMMHLLS